MIWPLPYVLGAARCDLRANDGLVSKIPANFLCVDNPNQVTTSLRHWEAEVRLHLIILYAKFPAQWWCRMLLGRSVRRDRAVTVGLESSLRNVSTLDATFLQSLFLKRVSNRTFGQLD